MEHRGSHTLLLLLLLLPSLSCSQDDDVIVDRLMDGPSNALKNDQMFEDMDKLFEDFSQYNKLIRPNYGTDEPTIVNVSIGVKAIASIEVSNMDYKMTIFLVQQWFDPRLQLRKKWLLEKGNINLPDSAANFLWTPGVFFDNEKTSIAHSVTTPNSMLKIYKNAKVLYSLRITLTLSCPMDIHSYPKDSQICSMTIISASYMKTEMLLQWDERSIIHKNLDNLQFVIDDMTALKNCTDTEIMGNLSCLNMTFKLHRNLNSADKQMCVSSILLCFLSCCTFILPISETSTRVSIGVATTISMTTQCTSAHNNMPKIPYMTRMDRWILSCLGLIVGAFIVNIVLICYGRKTSAQAEQPAADRATAEGQAPPVESHNGDNEEHLNDNDHDEEEAAHPVGPNDGNDASLIDINQDQGEAPPVGPNDGDDERLIDINQDQGEAPPVGPNPRQQRSFQARQWCTWLTKFCKTNINLITFALFIFIVVVLFRHSPCLID